jgi:hypothetical protein
MIQNITRRTPPTTEELAARQAFFEQSQRDADRLNAEFKLAGQQQRNSRDKRHLSRQLIYPWNNLLSFAPGFNTTLDMAKKLTKSQITRLLARDMADMAKDLPVMHSAPSKAFAPKVPKVATSNGRVSKADILRIREEVIREWEANQLNF